MFRRLRRQPCSDPRPHPDVVAHEHETSGIHLFGLPATAHVDARHDTGASMHGDLVLDLELTVHLEGRAPYRVTHREAVALARVADVEPGSTIDVRVDPGDHEVVLLALADPIEG